MKDNRTDEIWGEIVKIPKGDSCGGSLNVFQKRTWTKNSPTRENLDKPLSYVAASEERTFLFIYRRKWKQPFCFRSP